MDAEGFGGGLVRVERDFFHGVGAGEGGDQGGRLADVDRDHVDLGVGFGEGLDQGDRLLARLAPGRPKIEVGQAAVLAVDRETAAAERGEGHRRGRDDGIFG